MDQPRNPKKGNSQGCCYGSSWWWKVLSQTVGDQRVSSIQQQLASLTLKEAPAIGAFNHVKGEIVLAQFSLDNSWNRAMITMRPVEIGVETGRLISKLGKARGFQTP